MHELLAPLLYVLHVDVEHLSEVRKLYEDHFTDKFDGLSFQDNDLSYNFDFKKSIDSMEEKIGSQEDELKSKSPEELDPEIQTIVLLSDAYGAEGELGIVLSEKFMEHDAYCMFDALMSGAHGSVSMAEFFSPSPAVGSHTGLPAVIEASAALYHLLSFVDSSLHSHLIELGVEPQYFALRWLRVLFGREFSLGDLLIIWDEIFASENGKLDKGGEHDEGSSFAILSSPRGAFICAMAVSMLLYLRSSLLATENATSCLQRLLNFPENVNLKKLMEKAKSLQSLALNTNISSSTPPFIGTYDSSKSMVVRHHSDSFGSVSPKTPLNLVPESYWEEKWRVLHREEELKQGDLKKQITTQKKGWKEKVKLSLSRTESDPTSSKFENGKKKPKTSVRRRLLEDLSRELGFEDDIDEVGCHEVLGHEEKLPVEVDDNKVDNDSEDFACTAEERRLSGNGGSEGNSSIFSDSPSPLSGANDHENDSEKSSVASNISLDDNDDPPESILEDSPLPISDNPEGVSQKSKCNNDSLGNSGPGIKERKLILGKFQWLWKFGRNAAAAEGTSEKGGSGFEATKSANSESNSNTAGPSAAGESSNSLVSSKGDAVDQNVMGTLKNLGHTMLEHIQVSFFL